MAIKVGGTEVVDNNRQLKNIASVDATTVAALGTAGVGGGGGSLDFTASGSISSGDVVALNSNGTVSKIAASVSNPPIFNDSELLTGSYGIRDYKMAMGANPSGNNFLLAYPDTQNNNYLTVVVGQVDSTTKNISWGTPLSISSNNFDCELSVTYDPHNDAYAVIGVVGGEVACWRVTVSGLTPTYTGVRGLSNSNASNEGLRSCFDEDTNEVVVVWFKGSSTNRGQIASFDLTNSAPGSESPVDFPESTGDWAENADLVYDTNVNRCVHIDGQTNYFRWRIFSFTGGSLSGYQSGTNGMDVTQNPRMVFIPTENKICVIGRKNANPYGLTCVLGTVSTSTITFGSEQTIETSEITAQSMDVTYDTDASRLIFSYRVSGDFKIKQGSISGTTVTAGTVLENFDAGEGFNAGESEYLSNAKVVVNVSRIDNSPNAGKAAALSISSHTSTNVDFIGIAEENISNSASGKITIIGGVNEVVSGLTAKTTYYANETGGLTSTVSARKVGKALSSTKILVTEGNA